jgi:hypothetical protein
MTALTCVLTVHGIGFQQPSIGKQAGYADQLHTLLVGELGQELGDRLGTRTAAGDIDISGAPLVAEPDMEPKPRFAQVALVYSDLEDRATRLGSTTDTLARATVSFGHYAHLLAGVGMIVGDLAELLHRHSGQGGRPGQPSLYGFVAEALYRLSHREDVGAIVLNTHSQGTVLAFDVLSRDVLDKVRALVTAGSPPRKYVDLFAWGTDAGQEFDHYFAASVVIRR